MHTVWVRDPPFGTGSATGTRNRGFSRGRCAWRRARRYSSRSPPGR